MALLYDRHETATETVIVYKYHAAFYLILLAAIILPLTGIDPKWANIIPWIILGVGVLWIVGYWSVNSELRQAMKKGNVTITGSKFSFKKPFTFTIKKIIS